MEQYFILILMAILCTAATEPWKKAWDEFVFFQTGAKEWYDLSVGIFMPLIFSFAVVFGYGIGFLGIYLEGQYTTKLLLYADLIMTANIISLGANYVFEIVGQIVDRFGIGKQ